MSVESTEASEWPEPDPEAQVIRRSEALVSPPLSENSPDDRRLYVPNHASWSAQIKQDWRREFCYAKAPDEDYFHPLAAGEIYIQKGDEKFCLSCAVRLQLVTTNRLWWQKGAPASAVPTILPPAVTED